jgi:uncharacterized protein (DUF1697 family)
MTAASTTRFVALLRGINVGGGNVIKMTDLKACLEASRLQNVATYIASGNVLFDAPGDEESKLVRRIERVLSKTFSPYDARIVLCSHDKLTRIVRNAPKGFGTKPEKYRYDVVFLKPPLSASAAITSVRTKPGVDEAFAGPDVLYFSRLIARAAESSLPRLVGLPIYKALTVRNWSTTTKLLALMDARSRA